jgi:hypothetical protein
MIAHKDFFHFYKSTQQFVSLCGRVGFVGCLFVSASVSLTVFLNGRTILINSQKTLSTLCLVFADVSTYFIDQVRAFCSASSAVTLRLSSKSILFPTNIAGIFVPLLLTRKICSLEKKTLMLLGGTNKLTY